MAVTDEQFAALEARVVILESTVAALTAQINLLASLAQVNTITSSLENSVNAVQAANGVQDVSLQKINRTLMNQGKTIGEIDDRVDVLESA